MLSTLALVVYRVACFLGYGYVAKFIFTNGPSELSFEENVYLQTRFLTVDTMLLQILYFGIMLILMPLKCKQLKSALSCLTLTTSTIVSIMFWGLYFHDKHLILPAKEFEVIPVWLIHVTHTLVTFTALIDVFLSKPVPVPYAKSLTLVFAYYLSYALYTEYLIRVKKFYVYPLMRKFTDLGRLQFYGVVLCLVLLVYLVTVCTIRMLASESKRKSKKDKSKNKKSQQTQDQQQQQQQQQVKSQNRPSNQSSNGKKKKQKKQD